MDKILISKRASIYICIFIGLFISLAFSISDAIAETSYSVESSIDDEKFQINGNDYEAKTYCSNVEEGDEVIFTEGSAYGACSSAEFLNLRTKDLCRVWCE